MWIIRYPLPHQLKQNRTWSTTAISASTRTSPPFLHLIPFSSSSYETAGFHPLVSLILSLLLFKRFFFSPFSFRFYFLSLVFRSISMVTVVIAVTNCVDSSMIQLLLREGSTLSRMKKKKRNFVTIEQFENRVLRMLVG